MKTILTLAVGLFAFVAAVSGQDCVERFEDSQLAQPKNVLLIICDDLNTHLSPAGYHPIDTPTLD